MQRQDGFERVAQKRRTRNALLAATRELLAEGRQPTVQEAADRAGISRATAYRYFSKPEGMAEEAVLDVLASAFEQLDLGAAMARPEPRDRAVAAVSAILGMVLRNEPLFRSYLALVVSQGPAGAGRGGRRLRWLSDALAPLATVLPPPQFERLVHALSLLSGIETVVVLKDVCGLDDAKLDATVRWIAAALVDAALA